MLLPDELDLVVCRHDATRLLFAAWLKFYTRHGRPRGRSELHDGAVMSLARQLTVSPGVIGLMAWDGRTAERHRAAIRAHLGSGVLDGGRGQLAAWLAAEATGRERRFDVVRQELLAEFRVSGSSRWRTAGSSGWCARRCTRRRRSCAPACTPGCRSRWSPEPTVAEGSRRRGPRGG